MAPHWRRDPLAAFASRIGCVAAALLLFAAPALAQRPEDRLAQLDGTISIHGLADSVEVLRDRWGIPHIYARSQRDLFFAQGFIAAQDRLWQMDVWRRIGEGRLAEILGPAAVERDRIARLLKYRGDMTAEWTSYAPDGREIVTAFVAGVNAYVDLVRDRPPIEFTMLGIVPERWADDVPLQRMAALSMTSNALREAERARLIELVGVARAEALWPTSPTRALDPVAGVDLGLFEEALLSPLDEAMGTARFPRREGSNNWVVSGRKSATGKPLLANDPHRRLALPSLRYLSHLVAPGWNAIGAGEPALPGIAAGHNERVAFGFTIVGMDQQDLYVETVRECNAATIRRRRLDASTMPRCYFTGGDWVPVDVIVDTIRVRDQPPRVVRLEFTRHGPIVAEDTARDRAVALRFVGSEPGTAGYLAGLSLARATDWPGFLAAAARWKLPTENLVYADVDGNIGWVAAGLMPKRSWSGLLPVPGNGRYEWAGFLSPDELPRLVNPPSGFIVTANNNILPEGYDLPLAYEWSAPFRAERITTLLAARDGWTREDFERLQHDEHSLAAAKLVPLLLEAAGRRDGARPPELGVLARWDFVMRAGAEAPLLYAVWQQQFAKRTYAFRAGPAAASLAYSGAGMEGFVEMVTNPDRGFGANPAAVRDSLALVAFDDALVEVARLVRERADGVREWGAVHTARFLHPLTSAFDAGTVRRGGDGETVNSTDGPDYRQMYGASFREIIDLADWDNSVATSVPGQSGQPGSPHYADLLPLWAEGRYFPLAFTRARVERETVHRLWLVPGTR